MLATAAQRDINEVARQGRAIYEEKLKALLEPAHNGETVAIHVETGDYQVGPNSPAARFALRDRHPTGPILTTNIGMADVNDPLPMRMRGNQGRIREAL
jgi:hypothetical protein